MALFGNREEKEIKKEEKKEEKIQGLLRKYNLTDLDSRDKENIESMLLSDKSIEFTSSANFISSDEKSLLRQIMYQQGLEIDQKFLIIKQLDRLNKNLEKLLDK